MTDKDRAVISAIGIIKECCDEHTCYECPVREWCIMMRIDGVPPEAWIIPQIINDINRN